MKKLLALAAVFTFATAAYAQVVLYDGTQTHAITSNNGAASHLYSTPPDPAALLAYNSSNVNYSEVDSATSVTFSGFGAGNYLEVTNNGGVDGILRYNFSQSAVANFVNNTGTDEDPFLLDLENNNDLEFDVIWDGTGTFGVVTVDFSTNAAGGGGTIFTTGLTADVAQTINFDLLNNTTFQSALTNVANDANTSFAQLRILVQTASDAPGTFGVDNVQIVPEPTAALLLAAFGGAMLLRRRR